MFANFEGNGLLPEHALDGAADQTYDDAFFERLVEIEDRHFWFRTRNRVIGAVVRDIVSSLPPGYRVLEAGCGTGNVLRELERVCNRAGALVGLDQSEEGLRFARQRCSCALLQGDLRCLPCDEPFDLVGMFDVLEHLPDDEQVLRDLRPAVAPGGTLLITVPAHPTFWSYFDEASHHCRRYTCDELAGKLAGAGYEVEYITYYMAALFLPMWTSRRLKGLRHNSDRSASQARAMADLNVVPGVNAVLGALLAWEAKAITWRWHIPIGTSVLAVARRV